MKQTTKMILTICFALSATLCYSNDVTQVENESHIIVKAKLIHDGADRSSSILASITGHVLSIVFTENLGQVNIDITTDSGATVNYNSMNTPNGVNYYIPNTGSYIVYFTLSNGDQYHGEFEVTD